MTALERAREVIDEVIDIRRDIHAHPELSMQEQRTTQLVADNLTEMGIENTVNWKNNRKQRKVFPV